MTDFLLELRSEEIPARMQGKAREDLARLFGAELAKAGLVAGELTTYATPRRLALIARGLPQATQPVSEEVKGPKASAPPQALDGFLRKTGLARDQLVERGGILYAVTEKPGRATAAVLAEAIPAIVRAFPWPKAMRWGEASRSTESLRWVRPLQGIIALFGDDLVPIEIAGVASGYATLGHRFHHPGIITIGGAHDYFEKLRACHVVVDQDERAATIRDRAAALAAEAGLQLVEDEGLVAENAGLTEWPVPLLGRFDPAFLDVPAEVIQLTARVNQKYFVCRDRDGALANAFVCTANIDATDGGARIVEGNRKVLAARLSDARFFYDTDLKVSLEEQAKKLEKIVFHEKLGTVADKVDRVAKLARWLVEEGIVGGSYPSTATTPVETPLRRPREGGDPSPALTAQTTGAIGADGGSWTPAFAGVTEESGDAADRRTTLADMAEHAARLAKADLVTGMVGEFPELQGLIGGYYAAAQGEPREVWEAVRDHYKPVGQGDDVPTAPVTVAVSLADKLDTIAAFFAINERPTGSKDPFALRRAILASMVLDTDNAVGLKWYAAVQQAVQGLGWVHDGDVTIEGVVDAVSRAERERGPNALWRRFDEAFPGVIPEGHFPPTLAAEDFGSLTTANVAVVTSQIVAFAIDRLKVQQREAGVRHDLIDAVFALGGEDDLVRLLARVRALQAFVGTEDGANLLAGYKRAANILKKEGWTPSAPLPLAGGAGGGPDAADLSSAAPPPTPPPPPRAPTGCPTRPKPPKPR